MEVKSEQLAYWYLRLNGFLTIPNFIVHPDRDDKQITDVDVLGVRFPFREELEGMVDDEVFNCYNEKPIIVISEIKTGKCRFNDTWTKSKAQNVQRFLRALGAFKQEVIEDIANDIYERGACKNAEQYTVLLVCIGDSKNEEVAAKYPDAPQITWQQVSEFIYTRFKLFKRQKVSHGQWDDLGKDLWCCMKKSRDASSFHQKLKIAG